MIFDIKNWLWKYDFGTFWQTVIFFWTFWFLAKNHAFLDSSSLKFHNRTDINQYKPMHLLEHTWFLKWPLFRRTFGLWKLALCLREHNTKLNVAGKKQKTYLKAGAPAANGKRRPPMKNSATYTVVYFYWKRYQYLKFR